jgi:putative transcriptional regulator
MSLEEQHPPEAAPAPGAFQGQLLIATPVIGSGFFNRSLTYLCHHDADGAMGIVINQHLDLALSDMLEHLDIESISDLSDCPVLAGGPVGTEQGFVLHRGGPEWEGSQSVGEDLSLTTSRDILCALALGDGPEDYLVALGYAGWGPGQLEQEVSGNSWLTVPADRGILFQVATNDKLTAAGKQLGIDIDLLTAQAGHA